MYRTQRNYSRGWLALVALLLGLLVVACGPAEQADVPDFNPNEVLEDAQTEEAVAEAISAESEDLAAAVEETDSMADTSNDDGAMAESETQEDSMAEETNSADAMAEEIVEEAAIVPASEEVNAEGIPVGFTEDGHAYIGNINAPVVIEEYSDYQCPFCQRFYLQSMDLLKSGEIANGEAVLIFYDFPLKSIHPQATAAANAARCAGDQSAVAYWDMHDMLFEQFGSWSSPDPSGIFSQYASDIGIDTAAFDTCMAEERFYSDIDADISGGQRKGVRGTPAFVINGTLLSGAQPYTAFQSAIARAAEGEPAVAQAPSQPAEAIEVPVPEPANFSDNFAGALGDPNAPVTIVEFTDYQCPFCARHSAETLPFLLEELIDTGRVYYIMKDLPLDSIHPLARDAAAAARCAGDQDAYWDMHDVLFAAQSEWSKSPNPTDTLTGYASSLGLGVDEFSSCLSEGKYDAAIEENYQEAVAFGISGTPFFFVDGFPVINGAQPLNVFNQVVDLAENDELVDAIVEAQRQRLAQQQQQAQQQEQAAAAAPSGPVDVPIGDAYAIGDPDAPVTIVEYTDYQCPFCSRHHAQTFPQILEEFVDQGLVRYVFKDYPLNFHPQADEASQAARCAGEQESFLEMHSALFENQSGWAGSGDPISIFKDYAVDLGLDTAAFNECVDSGRYVQAVQNDFREGSSLGVRGTPAFFINGTLVSGAQPFNVFETIIRGELGDG